MLDRPLPDPLDYLQQVMADGDFIVLTGAGISTPSGIPDYRDTDGVRRGRQPMMYQEFLAAPESRRRYWARAMLGWPRVRQARPNAAHEALASLQSHGRIGGLITQNVDTLLDPAFEARFQVPHCPHCAGERMKPDVVFFGENVAQPTAARAMALAENAAGMLVVGSSLMAYSAFRLCRVIADRGKPLIAINLGKTRADELLELKIEASCEQLLPLLTERLT